MFFSSRYIIHNIYVTLIKIILILEQVTFTFLLEWFTFPQCDFPQCYLLSYKSDLFFRKCDLLSCKSDLNFCKCDLLSCKSDLLSRKYNIYFPAKVCFHSCKCGFDYKKQCGLIWWLAKSSLYLVLQHSIESTITHWQLQHYTFIYGAWQFISSIRPQIDN